MLKKIIFIITFLLCISFVYAETFSLFTYSSGSSISPVSQLSSEYSEDPASRINCPCTDQGKPTARPKGTPPVCLGGESAHVYKEYILIFPRPDAQACQNCGDAKKSEQHSPVYKIVETCAVCPIDPRCDARCIGGACHKTKEQVDACCKKSAENKGITWPPPPKPDSTTVVIPKEEPQEKIPEDPEKKNNEQPWSPLDLNGPSVRERLKVYSGAITTIGKAYTFSTTPIISLSVVAILSILLLVFFSQKRSRRE